MRSEVIDLNVIGDERGSLIALEQNRNVPFEIKRVYYLFHTREGVRRGLHAHKHTNQLVIPVSGGCMFLVDDGKTSRQVELNKPNQGLLLEGPIWREMFDFTEDCVLMVLSDALYDESDYIRDYQEFLKYVGSTR